MDVPQVAVVRADVLEVAGVPALNLAVAVGLAVELTPTVQTLVVLVLARREEPAAVLRDVRVVAALRGREGPVEGCGLVAWAAAVLAVADAVVAGRVVVAGVAVARLVGVDAAELRLGFERVQLLPEPPQRVGDPGRVGLPTGCCSSLIEGMTKALPPGVEAGPERNGCQGMWARRGGWIRRRWPIPHALLPGFAGVFEHRQDPHTCIHRVGYGSY